MDKRLLEKGILLTYDEIRVLFGGLGVYEIEGVYMPEKEFREEEILAVLHRLSKAGLIRAAEDRFVIREDVAGILSLVARPEDTQVWEPGGAEGPVYYLYFAGDQVVISEGYPLRKDTIRYTLADLAEFEVFRKESMGDDSGSGGSCPGEKV